MTMCKRLISVILSLTILLSCAVIGAVDASANSYYRKCTIKAGGTYGLFASDESGSWTCSDEKVATIDYKGVVTARKKGKAAITAKCNKKSYKCKLTVKAEKLPAYAFKKSLLLSKGSKVKLTVKKAKASKVKWSVKKKKIATVKKGVITAKKAGTTTITAKYGKKKYKCSVRVYSEKKLGTKTVTYKQNSATVSKVKVSFDPSMLDKSAKVTLKSTSGLPKLNGVKMKTYDFSLSGAKVTSNNVAVLEIPQKVKSGYVPVAGYFNEKTQKWKPVCCSYKNGKISIVTNHFSLFGVASVKKEKNWFLYNENTTREKVLTYWVPGSASISGEEALDIVSKSLKTGSIPEKCVEWGWKKVNDLFDINVNWKANISDALGISGKVTDFISGHTAEFGVIGFMLAYVDAIKYACEGNHQMAAYKAFNGYSGMVTAYLASKIGTAAMSASCFAITVVTAIVTKVYEDSLSSNERKWYKYYRYYYTHENPRKPHQWKTILLPILESKKSMVKIQNDVDAAVEKYVQEAWNSDWFAGYFYEATGQSFGVGGGLSKAIMNKLSAEYKHELMEGDINLVYEWYSRKLQSDAENAMQEQTKKLAEEFNKEFTIKFYDSSRKKNKKSSYAGWTVRWKNISSRLKDKQNLKLTLNSKGEASTEYTLFAAINYNIKPEVELVNKKGKVKKTLTYKITSNTTKVDLSGKASTSGTKWRLTSTKSYNLFYNSEFPDKNAKEIPFTYKNGAVTLALSSSGNSITSKYTFVVDSDETQSCTHQATLSQPPSVLSAGEKFKLTQSLKLVSKTEKNDYLSGPSIRTRITSVNPTDEDAPKYAWATGNVGSYLSSMSVRPTSKSNPAGTTVSADTQFTAPSTRDNNKTAPKKGDKFYLHLDSSFKGCHTFVLYTYTYE